jgi:pyruvate carboxylase subunit B
VTPVSQFYFQQAFNNVVSGPWKKIADGYGKMVLGYFGRTPVAPDPEIVRIAIEQTGLQPAVKTPLQMNDENPAKGEAAARKMLESAGLPASEENIFIAATCLEKGIAFLKGEGRVSVRKKEKGGANGYTVTVGGEKFSVQVEGQTAFVNGKAYAVDVREGIDGNGAARAAGGAAPSAGSSAAAGAPGPVAPASGAAGPSSAGDSAARGSITIKSPLPGIILRINIRQGDAVKAGDLLAILEVMKMETQLKAPADGVVSSINVAAGEQVSTGQVIFGMSV